MKHLDFIKRARSVEKTKQTKTRQHSDGANLPALLRNHLSNRTPKLSRAALNSRKMRTRMIQPDWTGRHSQTAIIKHVQKCTKRPKSCAEHRIKAMRLAKRMKVMQDAQDNAHVEGDTPSDNHMGTSFVFYFHAFTMIYYTHNCQRFWESVLQLAYITVHFSSLMCYN